MDDEELEYEATNTSGSSGQEVRKNIPLKLKSAGRGRGRGRGRKKSAGAGRGRKRKEVEEQVETVIHEPDSFEDERNSEPIDVKPTGPPESQKLSWDHKVNLIGEKVVDPLIHCCEKCTLPILIYGRMIPCKHVFCFDCAKQTTEKTCPRCDDPVQRIEQSALGTVFVCTFGGIKHGAGGCRRTYLSQRDLQAHMNHRHKVKTPIEIRTAPQPTVLRDQTAYRREDPRRTEDPRLSSSHPHHSTSTGGSTTYSIPVMSTRGSNLISVPIQDEGRQEYRPETSSGGYQHQTSTSYSQTGRHTSSQYSQGPPMGQSIYSTAGEPPSGSYSGHHASGQPISRSGGPPPSHHGGPPRWTGERPMTPPYNQQGSHSPNMPWSGQSNMGPPPRQQPPSGPPRGQYYQ